MGALSHGLSSAVGVPVSRQRGECRVEPKLLTLLGRAKAASGGDQPEFFVAKGVHVHSRWHR